MRFPALVLLLCMAMLQSARGRGFIGDYYAAVDLQKAGKEDEALGVFRHSLEESLRAKNSNYATSAGLKASFILYRQNKRIEAGQLCREVLERIHDLPATGLHQDAFRRLALFGLMERGLFAEGRIGAAWQANRAAAETLREKKVAPDADGRPVSVKDLRQVPASLRPSAWRLIEREAEYLDLSGQSQRALELLAEAAGLAEERWERLPKIERFYAFKLRQTHAAQLDFLGFAPEALTAQEALVEQSDRMVPEPSLLNLRLNILRNRSQWHGPSEEILDEAKKIGASLSKDAIHMPGVKRLLAKMELDLKESGDAVAKLAEAIRDHESKGELFEASYALRDTLAALTGLDRDGLDDKFIEVLQSMRRQGNKRGEPTVYGIYGRYLRQQGRYAEAIQMYREALRLVRIFDRPLHQVPYLCSLAGCYQDLGSESGARAVFAELDALLTAHPGMPAQRRVRIAFARARFFIWKGDRAQARAAFERARRIGKDLPAWQLRWVAPEVELALLGTSAPVSRPKEAVVSVQIQPTEVFTVSLPSRVAHARFVLANDGATSASGILRAAGPGAQLRGTRGFAFSPGAPTGAADRRMTLRAGERLVVPMKSSGGQKPGAFKARLAWHGEKGALLSEARWGVEWDPQCRDDIVLDASLLSPNPFRAVTFFHHLSAPLEWGGAIPFRMRSPRELRIEYYHGETGKLLAIDANGNGVFDEIGDFHVVGPANLAAAWLPASPVAGISVVEVRLSASNEDVLPLDPKGLTLEAQTFVKGAWQTEAEDVLR